MSRTSKRSRKNGNPLVRTIMLALLAAVALYLVLNNYVFVIRDVVVSGMEGAEAQAVIRMSQIPFGKPMRELDADHVRRSINRSGTYAFDSVSQNAFGRVTLTVHPRRQAALVQNAGNVLALDSGGYVIAQYAEVPEESAIYVTGLNVQHFAVGSRVSADASSLEAMTNVLDALYEQEAEALVSELNVQDAQQLYLYSRTGIRVVLGDADKMSSKIQWMKSALLDLESRGETSGRLDVSSAEKADFLAE